MTARLYRSNDLFLVVNNPVRDSERFQNRLHGHAVIDTPVKPFAEIAPITHEHGDRNTVDQPQAR